MMAVVPETNINWSSPSCPMTPHFTVKDALWLRDWNRLATEADGLTPEIKSNIVKTAGWMEKVREIVGKPIFVKSWWRSKAYNRAMKPPGALFSQHMVGNAVDWWTDADGDGDKDGADCDELKKLLFPHLVTLNLRMENNGQGARWIHLDDKRVLRGGKRFFLP